MKSPHETSYSSPLRQEQAYATRLRILDAVEGLFLRAPDSAFSVDEVAAQAGVDRRTVFRHFPSKETLIDAFWTRIGERVGRDTWPNDLKEIVERPPEVFERLETIAGLVRAAHVSSAGRELRLRQNTERRAAFSRSLEPVLKGKPERRRREAEAVVQLLYSATAYQTITDYWSMTGAEAGRAVAWAIETIVRALHEEDGTKQPSKKEEADMTSGVEGKIVWVMDSRLAIKGSVAGSGLIAAELTVPPGSGTPLHSHPSAETFFVFDGALTITTVSDREAPNARNATAGDFIAIAPEMPHAYYNHSDAPARCLVEFDPSLLTFFLEVGTSLPPPPGPPAAEAIEALTVACQRNGIRFVNA